MIKYISYLSATCINFAADEWAQAFCGQFVTFKMLHGDVSGYKG